MMTSKCVMHEVFLESHRPKPDPSSVCMGCPASRSGDAGAPAREPAAVISAMSEGVMVIGRGPSIRSKPSLPSTCARRRSRSSASRRPFQSDELDKNSRRAQRGHITRELIAEIESSLASVLDQCGSPTRKALSVLRNTLDLAVPIVASQ
jgi:hypothetical protein